MKALEKSPTGIAGLDEITGGGLPQGRTTIVCGGPGCGKTMLGIEFLVRGAMEFDEPGVLMAFEETPEDIARNVASLGFDINDLGSKKEAVSRLRLRRAQRDSRDRRLRSRRPVHPLAECGGQHRRQARDVRHAGGAIQRIFESGDIARGVSTPFPLAEGARPHSHRYRGTRRRNPDSPGPRRVCFRLRHSVGSPHQGPDFRRAACGS